MKKSIATMVLGAVCSVGYGQTNALMDISDLSDVVSASGKPSVEVICGDLMLDPKPELELPEGYVLRHSSAGRWRWIYRSPCVNCPRV